jgi:hypothetical protein
MTKFYANINKGDLLLVTHRDKRVFDGVVGMIAKRDLFQKSASYGSMIGKPQGDGQCIVFNIADFESLGNFYELTGHAKVWVDGIAVTHDHLIVPNGCEWVVENAPVCW